MAMIEPPAFPASRAEALERANRINLRRYARTRNALDGAVSHLSPCITHGVITLPQLANALGDAPHVAVRDKFVFELGWREFFRHAWHHYGNGIFDSLHQGPLPDSAYAGDMPDDVRRGCSGVPVIDQAVRQLYQYGYLHNHARMWLASYLVHVRKVHWRAGADWLYAHLLDGDLGSNHLSWQWVAGTGSSKPYLFNAENVARFAPNEWHSPGSAIDASYEALGKLAHAAQSIAATPQGAGIDEPPRYATPPPDMQASAWDDEFAHGRDVWLMHPWSLRAPPDDLPAHALCIGITLDEFHQAWPWCEARWRFVTQTMAAHGAQRWHGRVDGLRQALHGARSVRAVSDPHIDTYLAGIAQMDRAPRLFPHITTPCRSFSQWWQRATRDIDVLGDLPGFSDQR